MENLGFGLQISVIGMGLVFGLLALLWGVLTLIVRLDRTREDRQWAMQPAVIEQATPAPVVSSAPQHALDQDAVAAILTAVLAHKAALRNQAAPSVRSYRPGSLLFASRWVAAGRTRQSRVWQRR
jgi:Na+-transporting methylmalonyl-CoA/oxaloacetate decarboxylase gamma subunit